MGNFVASNISYHYISLIAVLFETLAIIPGLMQTSIFARNIGPILNSL